MHRKRNEDMILFIYILGFLITLCAMLYKFRKDFGDDSFNPWPTETTMMCLLVAFIWPVSAPITIIVVGLMWLMNAIMTRKSL